MTKCLSCILPCSSSCTFFLFPCCYSFRLYDGSVYLPSFKILLSLKKNLCNEKQKSEIWNFGHTVCCYNKLSLFCIRIMGASEVAVPRQSRGGTCPTAIRQAQLIFGVQCVALALEGLDCVLNQTTSLLLLNATYIFHSTEVVRLVCGAVRLTRHLVRRLRLPSSSLFHVARREQNRSFDHPTSAMLVAHAVLGAIVRTN